MATWNEISGQTLKSSRDTDPGFILSNVLLAGQAGINDVGSADEIVDIANNYKRKLSSVENPFFGNTSFDDLLAAGKGYQDFENIDTRFTADNFKGSTMAGDILGGVSTGAQIGGKIHPIGMLIGALAGAYGGLASGLTKEDYAWDEANKANEAMDSLNKFMNKANMERRQSYVTAANDLNSRMKRDMWANMAALGGPLHAYGTDWKSNLVSINEGGSHEQNPYGGVPYGIAQDGQPNLVEEGEVIWKDYAFSDRLNTPKSFKRDYNITNKANTFAEIANTMKEKYDERPNDPIAKRTLDDFMSRLAQSQESERQRIAADNVAAIFADGGPIHIAKNKKGTFTAAATKHGMGVQEFASKVLANKDKYSPAMVKKANFARNATKFKHALGGHLFAWGDWMSPMEHSYDMENYESNYKNPLFNEDLMTAISAQEPIKISPLEAPKYTLDINRPTINSKLTEDINAVHPSNTKSGNGWNVAGMAMRLASALGPALGALSAAWTKPKYEWSNKLTDEASRLANTMSDISYNPIGQYLAYKPFDRNYYLNRLDSQIAANRRAARNLSGGNRASALAAMNASDMAALDKYGQLTRAGEEYNQAQREKVAAFNRDTDKFNSQMDLEAQKTNKTLKEAKARMQLQSLLQALSWNRQDDMLHSGTLSQNLTSLFNNLGGVGTEIMNRADRKALADSGIWGVLNDLMKRNQIIGG